MNKKTPPLLCLTGVISMLASACEVAMLTDYLKNVDERNYRESITATPELDAHAKGMVPTADKALVYYYEDPSFLKYEWMYRLYVDDICVGRNLLWKSYYYWQLPPGNHVFESAYTKFTLNAVGGETYYINRKTNFWSGNQTMMSIDKETGHRVIASSRLMIADARLCGPRRAPLDVDKSMKNLTAPKDKALVSLYWPDGLQNIATYDYKDVFYLDHKCVGRTMTPGGYFFWQLTPGLHTFEAEDEKFDFTLVGGETYYIQASWDAMRRLSLSLVDNESGQKNVTNLRLLVPDMATCDHATSSARDNLNRINIVAPRDKALLYLFRNEHIHKDFNGSVYLDDGSYVELEAGTYIQLKLSPGKHTLVTSGGNITLDAIAGSTYYIRLEIIRTWLGGRKNKLYLMNNEDGVKSLEGLQSKTED